MEELRKDHYEECKELLEPTTLGKLGKVRIYLDYVDYITNGKQRIKVLEEDLEREKRHLQEHIKYLEDNYPGSEVNEYLDILIQKRQNEIDRFKSYRV